MKYHQYRPMKCTNIANKLKCSVIKSISWDFIFWLLQSESKEWSILYIEVVFDVIDFHEGLCFLYSKNIVDFIVMKNDFVSMNKHVDFWSLNKGVIGNENKFEFVFDNQTSVIFFFP